VQAYIEAKQTQGKKNQSTSCITIWMVMFLLINSLKCLTFYYTF